METDQNILTASLGILGIFLMGVGIGAISSGNQYGHLASFFGIVFFVWASWREVK